VIISIHRLYLLPSKYIRFHHTPELLWLLSGYQLSKRRTFLEIIENVSEVDNKIGHTLQEETYMKRNVTFFIFSEIILLIVSQCIQRIFLK